MQETWQTNQISDSWYGKYPMGNRKQFSKFYHVPINSLSSINYPNNQDSLVRF